MEWTKQGHAVGVLLGNRVLSPEVFGVDDVLDEIALASQETTKASPLKERPKALWLVPDGGKQPGDDETFYIVSPNGTLGSR